MGSKVVVRMLVNREEVQKTTPKIPVKTNLKLNHRSLNNKSIHHHILTVTSKKDLQHHCSIDGSELGLKLAELGALEGENGLVVRSTKWLTPSGAVGGGGGWSLVEMGLMRDA